MQITDRKIQRNFLKKYMGSNRIRKAWRDFQIHKYGLEQYVAMYNKNQNKKTKRITPYNANMI